MQHILALNCLGFFTMLVWEKPQLGMVYADRQLWPYGILFASIALSMIYKIIAELARFRTKR